MKTALILGASRGLGLAITAEFLKRGWRVIATERAPSRLAELKSPALEIKTVDINEDEHVRRLATELRGRALDVLWVNAGLAFGAEDRVETVSDEDFVRIMRTNALSPAKAIVALEPLVKPNGVIAAMSSLLGSVGGNDFGTWEVYRGSKAALNTLVRSFAARNPESPRAHLLLDPGWVRTEMGGPDAVLEIDESIPSLVGVVEAQAGRPGVRYLNYLGETVPW